MSYSIAVPSPFELYLEEVLKEALKEGKGTTATQIYEKAAKFWKAMPDEDRDIYYRLHNFYRKEKENVGNATTLKKFLSNKNLDVVKTSNESTNQQKNKRSNFNDSFEGSRSDSDSSLESSGLTVTLRCTDRVINDKKKRKTVEEANKYYGQKTIYGKPQAKYLNATAGNVHSNPNKVLIFKEPMNSNRVRTFERNKLKQPLASNTIIDNATNRSIRIPRNVEVTRLPYAPVDAAGFNQNEATPYNNRLKQNVAESDIFLVGNKLNKVPEHKNSLDSNYSAIFRKQNLGSYPLYNNQLFIDGKALEKLNCYVHDIDEHNEMEHRKINPNNLGLSTPVPRPPLTSNMPHHFLNQHCYNPRIPFQYDVAADFQRPHYIASKMNESISKVASNTQPLQQIPFKLSFDNLTLINGLQTPSNENKVKLLTPLAYTLKMDKPIHKPYISSSKESIGISTCKPNAELKLTASKNALKLTEKDNQAKPNITKLISAPPAKIPMGERLGKPVQILGKTIMNDRLLKIKQENSEKIKRAAEKYTDEPINDLVFNFENMTTSSQNYNIETVSPCCSVGLTNKTIIHSYRNPLFDKKMDNLHKTKDMPAYESDYENCSSQTKFLLRKFHPHKLIDENNNAGPRRTF